MIVFDQLRGLLNSLFGDITSTFITFVRHWDSYLWPIGGIWWRRKSSKVQTGVVFVHLWVDCVLACPPDRVLLPKQPLIGGVNEFGI